MTFEKDFTDVRIIKHFTVSTILSIAILLLPSSKSAEFLINFSLGLLSHFAKNVNELYHIG